MVLSSKSIPVKLTPIVIMQHDIYQINNQTTIDNDCNKQKLDTILRCKLLKFNKHLSIQ